MRIVRDQDSVGLLDFFCNCLIIHFLLLPPFFLTAAVRTSAISPRIVMPLSSIWRGRKSNWLFTPMYLACGRPMVSCQKGS